MNEVPLLRQLLTCEKFIVEKETEHISLINCRSEWCSDRFPTPPILFGIYGRLINGSGKVPMLLAISRLDTFDVFLNTGSQWNLEINCRNGI